MQPRFHRVLTKFGSHLADCPRSGFARAPFASIPNLPSCIIERITTVTTSRRSKFSKSTIVSKRPQKVLSRYCPILRNLFPRISWEEARDLIAEESDPACLAASEFIYNSPYVPALPQLGDYASETFVPQRPLLESVRDLTHRIHEEFKYSPKATSIDVPLKDVLRKREGVCQDFAHVMTGALRSVRLAARYVSGYVRPGPKVHGAQASHAWVEVFFPGSGWRGFDPTNDLMVSATTSPWRGVETTATSLR